MVILLISNVRQHKLGGGVGFFIKADLQFKLRNDLLSSNSKLYESIFAEIMQENGKNIIVGCIYKPPDTSVIEFIHERISQQAIAQLIGDPRYLRF
jgi:hypothetical protein